MSDDHSMFAIFRRHPNKDLAEIAEEHLQRDLRPEDRAKLRKAASKVSTHATLGSLIGLGLGVALAWKIRSYRVALFNRLRAAEKPVEVVFSNGRREPVPDLEQFLQPTGWGDVATFAAFSVGGLFLGGETGFLTGAASATRTINRDPESRQRIEDAFRKFRADVLRRELRLLESNDRNSSTWDKLKSQASGLASSLRG